MDTEHQSATDSQNWASAPSGGEHRILCRSESVKKDGVLSASQTSSLLGRYHRQHRNSWPTVEVAATAAAKAIKRTHVLLYLIDFILDPHIGLIKDCTYKALKNDLWSAWTGEGNAVQSASMT